MSRIHLNSPSNDSTGGKIKFIILKDGQNFLHVESGENVNILKFYGADNRSEFARLERRGSWGSILHYVATDQATKVKVMVTDFLPVTAIEDGYHTRYDPIYFPHLQ
jgi:hypothetical protein